MDMDIGLAANIACFSSVQEAALSPTLGSSSSLATKVTLVSEHLIQLGVRYT